MVLRADVLGAAIELARIDPTRRSSICRRAASRSASAWRTNYSWIAVTRIRNSLANTPNGGTPRIASEPRPSPQPMTGPTVISRGCRPSSARRPLRRVATAKKIADLVSE